MEIPKGYRIVSIEKQKEAQKKYYEANRDKINENRKKHFKERYNTDEEFREKQKAGALKRYYKKINLLKEIILADEIGCVKKCIE